MNDVLHDMLIWFAKFAAVSTLLLLGVHLFVRRRRKPTRPDDSNSQPPA